MVAAAKGMCAGYGYQKFVSGGSYIRGSEVDNHIGNLHLLLNLYATTIFTHLDFLAFGSKSKMYRAMALAAITLFFMEFLPKLIGVTNAKRVAGLMVPPINMISTVVSPVGIVISFVAKPMLLLFGFEDKGEAGVSDSELRLIVTGARDSIPLSPP